ncbi:hypothetical protein ACFOKF_17180 [Sphingobium rhizovicinum]|uniref:Uncharacterized protein n=1 Tax=Sphingobium rhizovicinum TaxID=432308 RepID=A0ABV7NHG0_9SPHN
MIQTATEFTDNLSTIDNIKSYLAGLVAAAFDNRGGEPVRLTYVGGEFAKNIGSPFEKHVTALADSGQISVPKTRRKLAPFVEAYCGDIFRSTQDAAGVYFVSPISAGEPNKPHVPNVQAQAVLRFHRAVWAAFIRPIEGTRRFLNLDNIGFTDAADPPKGGSWHEIDARFVLGLAPNAPVDGVLLQSRIEEWANHSDISISRLVIEAKPSRAQSRHLEQLFTIIDSLPPALAATWSIPAAVLKHLRDAR